MPNGVESAMKSRPVNKPSPTARDSANDDDFSIPQHTHDLRFEYESQYILPLAIH